MKVVLVRRGWSATGGAEAYLQRLAGALVRDGNEVELVGSEVPADAWPYGRVVNLQARSPVGFARAFARLSRDRSAVVLSLERVPDCDVFRAGDGVHAAWLGRRKLFEPLWRTCSLRFNPKHRALLNLEKQVLDPARTQFIIANSRMVAAEITHSSSFPQSRIFLVRNGYDAPGVPADRIQKCHARKELGIPEDRFVGLFVGTGWERKGLRHAIGACGRLGAMTLLVAGRGRAEHFSASHVRHLGPVQNFSRVLAAADVLVQPTWYDPFSNACLEGLAAGLPVITTRDNGFSEILEEGKTGSVISRADASAELVAALRFWRDALNDNAEVHRGRCFREAVQWSTKRNLAETMQVLARVEAER